MIIKHIVELETIINEDIDNPQVQAIKAMPEQIRQQFFTEAATSFIADKLDNANAGNSWALLRIAEKESV